MKLTTLTTTLTTLLLTTLTLALPAPITIGAIPFHSSAPKHCPLTANKSATPLNELSLRSGDGRAATIFKSANLKGESTFLPANNFCTDIRNIFGGFDGQVRSLSVEAGVKCDFYQEEGCNLHDFMGGGKVLEVGFRGKRDVRRWLGGWEGRVESVYCQRIV